MSQEPTDTPQPRGPRGLASRGTARGRDRLGGCPRLEDPISRQLALTGTNTKIPVQPSSTTIPNSGDADDLPASPRRRSGTRLDEDLPALIATGSRELATVSSLSPAAPPAPSGDAGPRPSGKPDALSVGSNTARAVEQSAALSASFGNADTNPVSALTTRSAEQSTPSLILHPNVTASLRPLQDSAHGTTSVPQPQDLAVQVRQYVATQVYRWTSREPGVVPPPDPYYIDRHHWPMKNWLLEKKEPIRHLRQIAVVSSPGRPWTANFRSECLSPPVIADPLARQVDLEELCFADGAREFTSVIVVLQTMLHNAGYAFLNLGPTSGRTLSPELLAADGQFIVRRDDAPFQALDRRLHDGDALMLTLEDQELLGTAMVTQLRLAHLRPRDWSESNRESADAPLSMPPWRGSGDATRVWGGSSRHVQPGFRRRTHADPGREHVVRRRRFPGIPSLIRCNGRRIHGHCDLGTGPSNVAEQLTFYVPVAEYSLGQDASLPHRALTPTPPMIRGGDPGGLDEETKLGDPMADQGPAGIGIRICERQTNKSPNSVSRWLPG
ncbi:hypothetical protein PHMEG_00020570 [Phytophthora megakarya]|uniref:Uncharacterized protein n=1 Tax=Phytophthora megakarya TaxID=4795 RepID=A0A225VP16_9STRA|nr:hypothetical protein PHMEG_00020570 [Phytophthora megakarya]